LNPKSIHIIAFDIPYPPDYGGVIDIFYKILHLHRAGVRVHLHYFEYGVDPSAAIASHAELEKICDSVAKYPRITGPLSALSLTPYIIRSRRSERLLSNLLRDDHPILFEGLHSCFYLPHPALKGRKKIFRESNIEHEYYAHLSRAEHSLPRKLYFSLESARLKWYEKVLSHADLMLAVSETDAAHLRSWFPGREVLYLPSFHRNNEVTSAPGRGSYILYHGNLSVPENTGAVEFLLRSVWTAAMPPLIIAGKNPGDRLFTLAGAFPNVRIIANPDEDQMNGLIRDAHIHFLYTAQPTGLKLKLLNALYNGRFCLVNPYMLDGTGLDSCCIVARTPGEFRDRIRELEGREFSPADTEERKKVLGERYSNAVNGSRLVSVL
jgi:hypothetical protein